MWPEFSWRSLLLGDPSTAMIRLLVTGGFVWGSLECARQANEALRTGQILDGRGSLARIIYRDKQPIRFRIYVIQTWILSVWCLFMALAILFVVGITKRP
jgi:hypothetical protein